MKKGQRVPVLITVREGKERNCIVFFIVVTENRLTKLVRIEKKSQILLI